MNYRNARNGRNSENMMRVKFPDAARVRSGSPKSARAGYDRQNQLCAHLILADIARYGGDTSIAAQWAVAVIEKQRPTVRGPLLLLGGRKQEGWTPGGGGSNLWSRRAVDRGDQARVNLCTESI